MVFSLSRSIPAKILAVMVAVTFLSAFTVPDVLAGEAKSGKSGKITGSIVGAIGGGAALGIMTAFVNGACVAFGGAAIIPLAAGILVGAGLGAAIGYGSGALIDKLTKGKGIGGKIAGGILGAVGGAAAVGTITWIANAACVAFGGAAIIPMAGALVVGAGLGALIGLGGGALLDKFTGKSRGLKKTPGKILLDAKTDM